MDGAVATAADCSDGLSGAALRAMIEVSSGEVLLFHQAQRGPDWQPVNAAAANSTVRVRETVFRMAILAFAIVAVDGSSDSGGTAKDARP